jgi:hypothetical protein
MVMVDWSRSRGLAGMGVCLGLAILAINFTLLVTAGPVPAWLIPQPVPMPWDAVEEIDGTLAGLVARTGRGDLNQDERLSVYIGTSTARQGIEPGLLATGEGRGERYAGLCGSGGDIDHLRRVACPLLRSGLRPRRVIVCVHATWLVGQPNILAPSPLNPVPPLLACRWREVARAVKRWDWLRTKRVYVNHFVRSALYETRVALFDRLDLDMEAFSPPRPDPWQPPSRRGYPQQVDAEFLQDQMDSFTGYGWFDQTEYDRVGRPHAEVLADVVNRLRDLDSEVLVVLMPEHSALRSRIPALAVDILTGVLRHRTGGAQSVVDFRATRPDSEFIDYCHLNNMGRVNFSTQLANWLRARPESDMRAEGRRPVAS